jgi:hypothetical protein
MRMVEELRRAGRTADYVPFPLSKNGSSTTGDMKFWVGVKKWETGRQVSRSTVLTFPVVVVAGDRT